MVEKRNIYWDSGPFKAPPLIGHQGTSGKEETAEQEATENTHRQPAVNCAAELFYPVPCCQQKKAVSEIPEQILCSMVRNKSSQPVPLRHGEAAERAGGNRRLDLEAEEVEESRNWRCVWSAPDRTFTNGTGWASAHPS
jgi:hypothetical protein